MASESVIKEHAKIVKALSDYSDILLIFEDTEFFELSFQAIEIWKRAKHEHEALIQGIVGSNVESMQKHNAELLYNCEVAKELQEHTIQPEEIFTSEYMTEAYGFCLYENLYDINWKPAEELIGRKLDANERDLLERNMQEWTNEREYERYYVGGDCIAAVSYGEQEYELEDIISKMSEVISDILYGEGITERQIEDSSGDIEDMSIKYLKSETYWAIHKIHKTTYGYYNMEDQGLMLEPNEAGLYDLCDRLKIEYKREEY